MFRSIDQFYGLPLSVGIFAYLNYHVPRTRREILEILLKGLQRLEYRGYDSAGKKNSPFVNTRRVALLLRHWGVCVCYLLVCSFAGVGIDGGNSKDWESNAKSIQLIKQRGKVKVLDEEIHSMMMLFISEWTCIDVWFFKIIIIIINFCVCDTYRAAGHWPRCGVWRPPRYRAHALGHTRRSQSCQQPPTEIWQTQRWVPTDF